MWKYGDITIREHSSWTDNNGIQHPRNWHIWSADEKAAHGLKEVTPSTPPDSRLYNWSMDRDGKINSTAKSLTDVTDDDGRVNRGVKWNLKQEVKTQQGSLLSQTDWAIVRKADKGTAIPSNIQTWRDAIRAKATEMEAAIDSAEDTDAIAALFLSWDADGNKTGILYDWPELD